MPKGTIVVSAAASLTDVFPVIAAAFQKRYPGTTVKFNFGGSSALVEQINAGAPVDVLATASEPTMWKAVAAGIGGTAAAVRQEHHGHRDAAGQPRRRDVAAEPARARP